MPLVLTDYQVFRKVVGNVNNTAAIEVDCPSVPAGSLWRVDQIACVVFPGPNPLNFAPSATLYDTANPGPTAVPIQSTTLGPYPPPYGNVNAGAIQYWADWDAEAGPFTILGGAQLAIVFSGIPGLGVVAIRVQYGLFMGTPGAPTPVSA